MNNSYCLQNLDVLENADIDWNKIKLGNENELTKLIKKNIGSIRQNAMVNQRLDEDLFQYLLVEVLEYGIPNFDKARSSFNTFINNLLQSRRLNYFNKAKNQKKFYNDALSLDYEYEENNTLDVPSDVDTENSVVRKDTLSRFDDILTEEQLYIIESYYYDDMTYAEIGSKLGVTYEAIRKRIIKIKKIIKRNFKQ